jgi:hypothetical protein
MQSRSKCRLDSLGCLEIWLPYRRKMVRSNGTFRLGALGEPQEEGSKPGNTVQTRSIPPTSLPRLRAKLLLPQGQKRAVFLLRLQPIGVVNEAGVWLFMPRGTDVNQHGILYIR